MAFHAGVVFHFNVTGVTSDESSSTVSVNRRENEIKAPHNSSLLVFRAIVDAPLDPEA
jgi:hypothetical protein